MQNKQNIIKVLNPEKAELLSSLGFSYVKEAINKTQSIYSFFASDELISYINKNFDKKDFVMSNRLNF